MKLRVARVQGALTQAVSCQVVLTRPSSELLPLVVGRFLLYGEDPKQVLLSLKLRNHAAVLAMWFRSGYITGSPQAWGFSNAFKDRIFQCVRNEARRLSLVEQPKITTSARFLLSLYRRLGQARRYRVTAERGWVAQLKRVCRKYPTEDFEGAIRKWFSVPRKDYSMRTFCKVFEESMIGYG